MMKKRIFLTGVGGQGTLTATTILARTAMSLGIEVTSGEIHGMAQRGGVVESTVLLGGWLSPTIAPGEADILLGFEPLETLRGLHYLAPGGVVVSSTEGVSPVSVSMGKDTYPDLDDIRTAVRVCSASCCFLPIRTMGAEAGAVQSGNLSLLGALCVGGDIPIGVEDLKATIRTMMRPALAEINCRAVELGAEHVTCSLD
jgi:indolepyruvate ferredoxin oxidoreductase, beta subunit